MALTLVTLTVAAREFGSYPKAWRRVTAGTLPAVRRGGRWYVSAHDVHELAQREQRQHARQAGG